MVAQQKLEENGMHNALPSYLPNLQCFRAVGLVILDVYLAYGLPVFLAIIFWVIKEVLMMKCLIFLNDNCFYCIIG